jgi:hypothetical protein
VQKYPGFICETAQADAIEKSALEASSISVTDMGASPVLRIFISLVSPLDPSGTPLHVTAPGVTLMTGAIP